MKIRKDKLGLYTICGGYISRPFFGTIFKEGDIVITHHFGGSTLAGVTCAEKKETHNFKRNGKYEYWSTTGISSYEYKNKEFEKGYEELYGSSYDTFEEYLKLNNEWYKSKYGGESYLYKNHNKEYKL